MKFATLNGLLTLILILLFSGITFAQQSEADRLRFQISKEGNDTSRVKLLIQLWMHYASTGSKDYDIYLKEAYDFSKKNKYRLGLAYGLYYEGRQLSRVGKYNEAIDKFKMSIDEFDSIHYIQPNPCPLSGIRVLYNLAGRQEEKFRFYLDKVSFYKRHGPIENTANCYHAIAGYYNSFANYDKAIEYYLRAREVYKSFEPINFTNENEVIGATYLSWGNLDKAEYYLKLELKYQIPDGFFWYYQVGNLYLRRHDYKQALKYFNIGRKYATLPQSQAINFVNCAAVHLALNSRDSILFYLDSAEKIRKKEKFGIGSTIGNIEIDYYYYKYYLSTGSEERALQHLEIALHDAELSVDIPLVLKYSNELHSFLLKRGDSLRALRYLIQYNAIQDSINTMNTKARIASFEIEQQQQAKENEIEQLQVQKKEQRNYYLIGGAFLLLIVMAVISLILYRRKRDKELLTTDFRKQLAQAETKALRAQMNPHFIFNSLNSINSFVIGRKHEIASDYLIKFSKLIRLILDNSRSETISIEKELETLKLYVILEAARFDNKFKCLYQVAGDVETSSIMIPPMLLQPFVENAIWHGLMQKEGEGIIRIEIKMENEEFLNISITDDGIGREKAAELKSKSATHKSHGLKVTSQRIEMMNKLNSTGAQVHIIDLKDENGNATGTRVELIIPV